MLSLKECISLCGLTEDEVEAIAEREHLPAIIAAQVGCQLLRSEGGVEYIRCVLRERADRAAEAGDLRQAAQHFSTYADFKSRCPGAMAE